MKKEIYWESFHCSFKVRFETKHHIFRIQVLQVVIRWILLSVDDQTYSIDLFHKLKDSQFVHFRRFTVGYVLFFPSSCLILHGFKHIACHLSSWAYSSNKKIKNYQIYFFTSFLILLVVFVSEYVQKDGCLWEREKNTDSFCRFVLMPMVLVFLSRTKLEQKTVGSGWIFLSNMFNYKSGPDFILAFLHILFYSALVKQQFQLGI